MDLFEFPTSSSSSDDENLIEPTRIKKIYRPRINFSFNRLWAFTDRFRLSSDEIENIVQNIGPQLQHNTDRNSALSPTQQLLLAIRYLAGGGFMITIGDAHGPVKSTVSRSVHAVVNAINNRYFNEIVKWPDNIGEVVAAFYKIAHFPCCIGAIDGCQILIKRPVKDEHQFVNGRTNKHSINTMMVCGPTYEIFYLSARRPGCVNDQAVLDMSTLSHRFDVDNWQPIMKPVLVGDSGYKLRRWVMTPIQGNDLTDSEERYNRRQKRTRVKIECTFGILKKRFACLEKLRLTPEFAAAVIKSCVIFHNMALRHQPVMEDEIDQIMEEIEERTNTSANFIEVRDDGASDREGLERRAELVAFFSR